WSLRNRLIIAYLFIAVVPILLIVILVGLAARIVYSQLGAFLLYEDIQTRKQMLADISQHIFAGPAKLPPGVTREQSEQVLAEQFRAMHMQDLPGLSIEFSSDPLLLRRLSGPAMTAFTGLLQEDKRLSLTSIRAVRTRSGEVRVVTLRVPVTAEFLSTLAPDLGAIQLSLMDRYAGRSRFASGRRARRIRWQGQRALAGTRRVQRTAFAVERADLQFAWRASRLLPDPLRRPRRDVPGDRARGAHHRDCVDHAHHQGCLGPLPRNAICPGG